MDGIMKEYFERAGIILSEEQIQKFEQYYTLLVEWNKKINLTSIIEWNEVVQKHFLDSAMISKYIDFTGEGKTCIDVGTGAGFPGIPLAILFPNLKITLLDAIQKKIYFLNEVKNILSLSNVMTVNARAEDAAKNKEFREVFDFAVSRAVSNISTLLEYCIPFIKKGGQFISYKSVKANEEIKEYKNAFLKLGCFIQKVETFYLPETDLERNFIIISKQEKTDLSFPRRVGRPLKYPIK